MPSFQEEGCSGRASLQTLQMRFRSCVVHVEGGEEGGALLLGGGGKVDADVVRAGGAVDLAGASENARCRDEGAEEGSLVLCHCILDKVVPVLLTESFAHAALLADAGPGLREEGAPPLGGAVCAELPDV